MAVDTKGAVEAERAAEGLSGWAFVGTLLSWLMLLLGLRVVDTQEGLAKLLTGLGVLLLLAATIGALVAEAAERRRRPPRGAPGKLPELEARAPLIRSGKSSSASSPLLRAWSTSARVR